MTEWRIRLKQELEARNISMRSLSLKLGTNESLLRDMINRGHDPSIETLAQICDELGISLSRLIDKAPEDPEVISLAKKIQKLSAERRKALETIISDDD